MDQSSLLYGAITLVVLGLASLYVALVIWSPPPIVTRKSETNYLCHASPKKPRPLATLAGPSTVDLTVVVPAYNETERLPIMLASTITHLTSPALKTKRTFEIVIVDDGSSDNTAAAALKLTAKYPKCDIRVVTLEKNLGKGGARLLMVDADDASRFADLEDLWTAMDKIAPDHGAGVVVGSRAHLVKTEAVVKRSLLRNILMYGLHTILRICGFKLFSRAAAQQIFPAQHLPTWIFDQLRIPVAEVPIQWHEVPGSKLNVVSASLQMLRDLLIVRANHLLGRWKAIPSK
ncbi:glycosyltransferase family 2 protein [Mycena olivaceomarginata]|nr:glycosyltransferase family 2 protein [Mycena olivaceomarginata]